MEFRVKLFKNKEPKRIMYLIHIINETKCVLTDADGNLFIENISDVKICFDSIHNQR